MKCSLFVQIKTLYQEFRHDFKITSIAYSLERFNKIFMNFYKKRPTENKNNTQLWKGIVASIKSRAKTLLNKGLNHSHAFFEQVKFKQRRRSSLP